MYTIYWPSVIPGRGGIQFFYRSTRLVSQNTRLVPQNTRLVSQNTRLVPQNTRLVSQNTRLVPQYTRLVSQDPRFFIQIYTEFRCEQLWFSPQKWTFRIRWHFFLKIGFPKWGISRPSASLKRGLRPRTPNKSASGLRGGQGQGQGQARPGQARARARARARILYVRLESYT